MVALLPRNPHYTLTTFFYFFFFLSLFLPIYTYNLTQILSEYPDLYEFTSLLTTAGISGELDHRTSLTILAVPNSHLTSSTSPFPPATLAETTNSYISNFTNNCRQRIKIPPAIGAWTSVPDSHVRSPDIVMFFGQQSSSSSPPEKKSPSPSIVESVNETASSGSWWKESPEKRKENRVRNVLVIMHVKKKQAVHVKCTRAGVPNVRYSHE